MSSVAYWLAFKLCNVTKAWAKRGSIPRDRKSTRLNSSHVRISYAVFCSKKKNKRGGASAAPAAHRNLQVLVPNTVGGASPPERPARPASGNARGDLG